MKFTNEISIWNCHLFPLIFFDCHFKSHLINEDMYDVRSLSMNTVEELVGCVLMNTMSPWLILTTTQPLELSYNVSVETSVYIPVEDWNRENPVMAVVGAFQR